MLEPISSPLILPRQPADRAASVPAVPPSQSDWLLAIAPLSCAALWAAATGASFLFWSVTGSQGPLDWCRSGGGLIGTGALTGVMLLVATVGRMRQAGQTRLGRPSPGEPSSNAALLAGWSFEEGGFTPV
jgi:hypothetical protein